MGNILFLDDMQHRHDSFCNLAHMVPPHSHVIHQVYTAKDAIRKLGEVKFDQAFLDHDLSDEDIMVRVGEPTKRPTGMDVVDHIMKMKEPPMDIIVHSCNGPAAWAMALKLAEHPAKIRVRRLAFPDLLSAMRSSAI